MSVSIELGTVFPSINGTVVNWFIVGIVGVTSGMAVVKRLGDVVESSIIFTGVSLGGASVLPVVV